MRFTTKLLPSRSANVGFVQLNNPKALHALNLEMIHCLVDILPTWQSDPTMRATIFSGSALENNDDGKKKRMAFCAGGDVKTIYMAGKGILSSSSDNKNKSNSSVTELDVNAAKQKQHGYGVKSLYTADFFREEYQVNHLIAEQMQNSSNIMPQISLWDGIVMGGGVGISIHGKYRIATENTLFAMPETGIGLFPDVGSMYWLPRLEKQRVGLGRYIALTGARLEADDLMYCGIATHYIPSEKIEGLVQALVDASRISKSDDNDDDDKNSEAEAAAADSDFAAAILMAHHEETHTSRTATSFIAKHHHEIEDAFSKDTMEDIITTLEKSNSQFGENTLKSLQKASPTSLKVTLEGMKRSTASNLSSVGDNLKMEYRMMQRFMNPEITGDFYEGIRAQLVDKDRNPKWEPKKLEDVSDELVNLFFDSLGENELSFDSVGGGSSSGDAGIDQSKL